MLLNKPKRIEDYILSHLKNGPVLMLDLVKKLQEDRPGTTKQAVYASLRLLKQNEQIITFKGLASLNIAWLNQMINYFNFAKHNYVKGENQGSFIDLEDKEKIKYYFQNSIKADIFWTHAYYLLMEQMEEKEPIFLYNPHEWFLLARNENEKEVIKTTIERGHPFLMASGGNTFLDKYVRKYYSNELDQYYSLEKPLFKENNYYVNIFGDFLIEVWLDKNITEKVEKFYQATETWNNNIPTDLKNILDTKGRMKMVISRNHKKAERIKRSLKKYFSIKN
ncbi:MAG: hypothetical protein V1804_01980 [Patescibacteria group bacterium]